MGRRRRRQVFFLLLLFFFLQAALPILATSTTTTAAGNAQPAITEEDGEERGGAESTMLLRKTTLGSRPPSCAGRCRSSCGRRCEAVQVPVTPHDLLVLLRERKKKETLREAGAGARSGGNSGRGVPRPSSYDDRSNYKPLGWRCRCLHS